MDILKRKHEDIKCLIIGDISKLEGDRRYLENLKSMVEEKNLGSYVHLTGFRKDIPDIVSALDVLLLPSIAPEPFGRVVLEAMIFSKPVIATAHGGPLDIIEDNLSGFLVKPNDPEALADKIEYLKNHIDIIKAVGERARRRVEECFTIGKNVKKIELLYSRLL
jgi:glycosyltransferase involved in cell wall biosynthesis